MRILKSLTIAIVFALAAQPLWADDETELLRQQVKMLEARLDALEKKQAAQAQPQVQQPVATATTAGAPTITPTATTSTSVAQRLDALEQKEATDASVTYTAGNGLQITSPDKDFKLHIGGYFQFDDHAFVSGATASNTDQFFIRSARPIFEAQLYDQFSARLMLDYGNNQTTLLDAYGDYKPADAFNIRVGKFKDPIGIERWQSEQNLLFVERGMTTNLVPYRDNGVQLYGNIIPKTLEYQIAFTNGAPDQVNSTNTTDNDQAVTARVFAHPFHSSDVHALQGVGVGVAGAYGDHNGSLANPDLTTGYVTPAQSKFFTYNTTAYASGEQWRFNPQATYYNGPFSAIAEYVLEDQDLRVGTLQKGIEDNAWEAMTTYVLTGENASFDGVIPRNNFDPAHDEWGAFEIVGRFSALHIDDAAFPLFASLATSAKDAQETTVGGTWYMNPNIKFNLDFAVTQFTGGAAGNTDRATEKAVLTRAQVKF